MSYVLDGIRTAMEDGTGHVRRWLRRMLRPRTAKGLLDEFFEDAVTLPPGARTYVWDILTALRGPDDEFYELKKYTTARIRHAVCEDLARSAGATVEPGPVCEPAAGDCSSHFGLHIHYAVRALAAAGYVTGEGDHALD